MAPPPKPLIGSGLSQVPPRPPVTPLLDLGPRPPRLRTGSGLDQAPPLPSAPPLQTSARSQRGCRLVQAPPLSDQGPPRPPGPLHRLPPLAASRQGYEERAPGVRPPLSLPGRLRYCRSFQFPSTPPPPPSWRSGRRSLFRQGTEACPGSHAWDMRSQGGLPVFSWVRALHPPTPPPLQESNSPDFLIAVFMPAGVPGKAGLPPTLQKRHLGLERGWVPTGSLPSWSPPTWAASGAWALPAGGSLFCFPISRFKHRWRQPLRKSTT